MSVLVVIPARYASVRFPGKPLALLAGKPMIQHVYEQVAGAACAEEVIIATDDERIMAAAAKFGAKTMMTNPAARSGSERVAEVARSRQAQVVINVQGDEPLMRADMVDQVAEFLEAHQAVPMASLMTPLTQEPDAASPNVVKVVTDRDGFALYFSRAPIPFQRADAAGQPGPRYYKHIGIYGYQRHFLLQFPSLAPTRLEQCEQLEQLRALEHGYRIKLLQTAHDSIGVDTPDDLRRVERLLADAGKR